MTSASNFGPPHTLAVLLFEGFELLDVFGPLEMFGQLRDQLSITMVAQAPGPVRSAQGPAAYADLALEQAARFDAILVPGGIGTRAQVNNPAVMEWIAQRAASGAYVLSVCTGSGLLARAGVLTGRRATTNKMAFAWVREQGPSTDWVAKARWVRDGAVYTSAGVSAGMDMALGFISDYWGRAKAEQIALWSEYEWNDDPTADRFAQCHGLA